ncbi:histidine kinase [Streptomyces sp. RKAG293]|uniref:sensor histidine kinase n=1 Tax=Streptomyces sp. RKAG293 TaxID=2893403 RepID=UPI002034060D|nr:histidine kinase [Streptomyces sp. RKAG293]MCM2420594.1 histidine kinase [Streptomyces sp. RKAG293]
MLRMLRPVLHVGTYVGWVYAFTGALLGLLPVLPAAAAAAIVPSGTFRTVAFSVVYLLLFVLLGYPEAARTASVHGANRLLGTAIPVPMHGTRFRVSRWLRTSAWLGAHAFTGAVLMVATALLLVPALTFPLVWRDGGDRVDLPGASVRVGGGWAGAWSVPVALAALALTVYLSAAAVALLRGSAPFLLAHGAAERLTSLEEQRDRLARSNQLAQELHDSIGHTLTASTIQAAVAAELMETDPVAARRALAGIEDTSRAALEDLDHVLGVLRAEPTAADPHRTLDDLRELTENVRAAGTALDIEVDGDLADVPADISREGYRIVQEGLTNAMRHGAPGRITLRLRIVGRWLRLDLANPIAVATPSRELHEPAGEATAPSPPPRGRDGITNASTAPRGRRGLAGIAERARLLRGELTVGPEDGQWRLLARLPLRDGR